MRQWVSSLWCSLCFWWCGCYLLGSWNLPQGCLKRACPNKKQQSKPNKPCLWILNFVKQPLKRQCFSINNKLHTQANWEACRMQRNLSIIFKRQSIRNYFSDRCAGGPKSKDFWPTVAPKRPRNNSLGKRLNYIRPNLCCRYAERVLCKCRSRHSIWTYLGRHTKPSQNPNNNCPHLCYYCFWF